MSAEFAAKIAELAERARRTRDSLQTEHATKSALVMPFLAALGYDVFNPLEVVPEYTADVGTKRGEKVDFAILRDGQPTLIIECKSYGCTLDPGKCNQLYRYFTAKPSARIGVLTNGTKYLFFTDLEQPNIMDSKPYMEFDLEGVDDSLIPEVAKLSKGGWDLEATISAASELKYTRAIKRILADEVQKPSDDLVRFFVRQVYPGHCTAAVKEQFAGVVKRAFRDFLKEQMTERFKAAVDNESQQPPAPAEAAQESEPAKVVTTEEEWQGYYLVKTILRDIMDPRRVAMRDAQSYCAVLLDDNNRKPICRLRFNRKQKAVGVFDTDKNEEIVPIMDIDDIFNLADRLKKTIIQYEPPQG